MSEPTVAEVTELVERIRPLLAGRLPQVQGAVLAELLATWVKGHRSENGLMDREVQDVALSYHLTFVRKLMAIA